MFSDGLVADNFCRLAGPYHLAVVDYIRPIDHLERPLDIMVGNENTDAGGNKSADFALQVFDGNRVNAAKRLVQKNQ
ncbi:hypothetical protein ES703_112647 [subsurface metagenome]